jgi:two-component system, NtrC family, sensor kinase
MTLQRKLALFLVVAAVAPLVGVGFAVLSGTQRELGRRTVADHEARARSAAAAVATDIAAVTGALEALSDTWRPDRLGERELAGLLFVLSRQLPASNGGAIVDPDGVARAVQGEGGSAAAQALVAALRASASTPPGRLALRAYDDPARGWQLAALRAVPARDGRSWLVGARVGPDHVRARLDAAVPEGGAAWLVDAEQVILGSTGAGALPPAQRAELAGRLDPARAGSVAGRAVVAAWAPLDDGTGWSVLVAVPAERAYARVIAMRRGVLAASATVLAAMLLVAYLLARGTTRGLARIDAAARALGAGELAVRLPEGGGDEVAQVSRTFNAMAGELQQARLQLERWNEELRTQVEARARDLERTQAGLVEAQKLAAVGQLGAGVAHEINNPLTGILGNAQLLLEETQAGDPRREPLAAIEALARRCRDVTQRLLRFSEQRASPSVQVLELNRVVADAVGFVEGPVAAAGLRLEVSLAPSEPRVKGDPGQLVQVALNLLSNARTACLERPGAAIRVSTAARGDEVELVVEDEGRGIAPEHVSRVFEPFFTTKDQWSSVGLGLSVAYRIVAEHGGRIEVDSRPGRGSLFTVRLPAARGPAA